MKRLLFAASMLSSMAHAQEVKCPDFYPEKQITLTEIPSGHKGSGLQRGANLSSAFIYVGELHSDPSTNQPMQEVPNKVKGGWDMSYNFTPKEADRWLVCVYGGDRDRVDRPRTYGTTEWWERIDPKLSSCVLKFRETKQAHHATSVWSAAAVCN